MATKPYKGNDNYIFISYAHKDIEEVLSFIQRLQAEAKVSTYGLMKGSIRERNGMKT